MAHRFPSNWNVPNEPNQNDNRQPPLLFPRQQLVCYGCNRPGHKIRYCNYTAEVNGGGTGAHASGSGGSPGGYNHAARTNRYNPLAQHNRFDNSLAGHRTNRVSGHNGAQPFHRGTNYQMNGGPHRSGQFRANYGSYDPSSRPSCDRREPNNVPLEQAHPTAPPSLPSPFTAQSYEQMTTSLTYAMCNWVSSNMQLYSTFVKCVQQSLATMAPPTEIQQQQPQPDLSKPVLSSSNGQPKDRSKQSAQ